MEGRRTLSDTESTLQYWHRGVLLTCPRPGDYHGGGDNKIRSEFNNPFIPMTWGSCCSPDCARWMDGYLENAAQDDPVRLHLYWNAAACEAMCDDYDRMVERCEHDWQETSGHCRTQPWDDFTGEHRRYFKLLRCARCFASKQGEEMESPYV